jgi:hypothetical protein
VHNEHCVVFGGMGDPPSANETVDVANIKIDVARIKRTIVFMVSPSSLLVPEPVLGDTLCAFLRGLAACSKIERFVKSQDAVNTDAQTLLRLSVYRRQVDAECGCSFCPLLKNESKTE